MARSAPAPPAPPPLDPRHVIPPQDPHALRSLLFQTYPKPTSPSEYLLTDSQHHQYQQQSRGHGQSNGGGISTFGNSSGSIGGGGGGGSVDPVQSKADFLSAFTEDPLLLNFARHFCDAASGGAARGDGGDGTLGLPSGRRLMIGADAIGDAPVLARYFSGALLECLAGEKEEALGPHLSLCHAAVTARHTTDASAAWDLRLVLAYGRGSVLQAALALEASKISGHPAVGGRAVSGGQGGIRGDGRAVVDGDAGTKPPQPFALLHPELLASLEVQLTALFSSLRLDARRGDAEASGGGAGDAAGDAGNARRGSPLWQYLSGAGTGDSVAGLGQDHRLLGAFLVYFGIPAPSALEEALGGRRAPAGGLSLADIPALVRRLPGISPSALLRMTSSRSS